MIRLPTRLLLTLSVTLLLVGAAPAQATVGFGPCKRLERAFSCGKLQVPLDYSGAVSGELALDVRRLHAEGRRRGTIVMLSGGPGQAAIEDSSYDTYLSSLMPGYEIVEFDQRGTGAGALRCPSIDKLDLDVIQIPADAVTRAFADCARLLGPNRRFYTSIDSARDIDRLRSELGLERIAIGGVSYGTFVAQVYARLFPEHTERLLLDSVVNPKGVEGIYLTSFAATRRILGAQCAGERCIGVTHDLLGDVRRLQTRMLRQPLTGKQVDSSGRPRPASLGGPQFPTVLDDIYAAGDLNPFLHEAYPAAVRAALDGDSAPLLRLKKASSLELPLREFSNALFAATACAEDVLPWQGSQTFVERIASLQAALVAQPDSAFDPWGRAAAGSAVELSGCIEWPGGPFSGAPPQPLPDVPALLLVGTQDTRTPIEDARAVAAQLPHSTLVTVPNTGHSVIGSATCVEAAIERFMRSRPVGVACKHEQRVAYDSGPVPGSIDDLRATGGAKGLAGRTASAAFLTLTDATTTAELFIDSNRAPGLRAGFVRLEGDRFELHDYSYVPGVELSGTFSSRRVSLTVSGSEAAHGTLSRRRKGKINGHLGGKRVRFKL